MTAYDKLILFLNNNIMQTEDIMNSDKIFYEWNKYKLRSFSYSDSETGIQEGFNLSAYRNFLKKTISLLTLVKNVFIMTVIAKKR